MLPKIFWICILIWMGTAATGIGIKIIYWTIANWLPSFDYFDGISLVLVGVVAYIQALNHLGGTSK